MLCDLHCLSSRNVINDSTTPLWQRSVSSHIAFFEKSTVSHVHFVSQKSSVEYSGKKTHIVGHSVPDLFPFQGLDRIGALRPLAGAGLAALLSVEPVVTNAVLRDQVTPAEMVHTVFICRGQSRRMHSATIWIDYLMF